ncbi:hypothetical protein PC128_g7302 [Phytophthora cactorum]|nr:hypothetical protein PC120_g4588 [Phytophthora cactorum]KAG3196877.1 hypothetical protein PC128_g7302 [Phytophthora cactorum]KAG4047012.1 hypothetical protein PC123_g17625 [Phytophthora cactorum]
MKQDEDGDCSGLSRQVGATSDRSSKPSALAPPLPRDDTSASRGL